MLISKPSPSSEYFDLIRIDRAKWNAISDESRSEKLVV